MGDLHLVKLCVGVESVPDLARRQAARRAGTGAAPCHVTRMWPRRADELLAGGSLYWVIRGVIAARQTITALERETGPDGTARCRIVLGEALIRTRPAPRRPFQGWRYLDGADAPGDLAPARPDEDELPAPLARALDELGVV